MTTHITSVLDDNCVPDLRAVNTSAATCGTTLVGGDIVRDQFNCGWPMCHCPRVGTGNVSNPFSTAQGNAVRPPHGTGLLNEHTQPTPVISAELPTNMKPRNRHERRKLAKTGER